MYKLMRSNRSGHGFLWGVYCFIILIPILDIYLDVVASIGPGHNISLIIENLKNVDKSKTHTI